MFFIDDAISYVRKLEVKGSKFGLERTRALLNALGSPDEKLKIIHVAGTNGKGSVCAYVSSVLKAAGKKCGTFTSPEVYSYNEKFVIGGSPCGDDIINKYLNLALAAGNALDDKPTAFELETAAALKAFADIGCEYAVLECGLGGLQDATNAISKKEIAVISSVSLEHTAVLGGTIEEICRHKAGIIKNCPAIVSALQCAQAKKYFKNLGVRFADDGLQILHSGADGCKFSYRGREFKIKLLGTAQVYNAAVAIECALALNIDWQYIYKGLENAEILGRVEIIKRGGKTLILDGSHNPASFEPLVETVKSFDCSKSLVYGCLSDKDVTRAAEILGGLFEEIITVTPTSYRAMSAEQSAGAFKSFGENAVVASRLDDALNKASGELIVVCGTFTVLRESKEWIEKKL